MDRRWVQGSAVLLPARSPVVLVEWPWRGSEEESIAKQLFFRACVQNCSLLVGINSQGVIMIVPWDAQHSAALPEAPMCEQREWDLSTVQVWVGFSSCLLESEGSAWLYVRQPGASEMNDLTREEFAPLGVCLDLELSWETSLSPGASRSCCSSSGCGCLFAGVPSPKARVSAALGTCQGS